MFEFYQSIAVLYAFVVLGFVLQRVFRERIDAKSFAIANVYAFQPLLAFWGFTVATIDLSVLKAGLLFLLIAAVVTLLLKAVLAIFAPQWSRRAVCFFVGTNPNTGNMGIPLAGMFFGPIGIVTATMVNFANIIWNVTFGVYFFARGKFDPRGALLQVIKMPLLWASIAAIACNLADFTLTGKLAEALKMGSDTSIVLQLFLLGIFFGKINWQQFDWVINSWVSLTKFVLLPTVGIAALSIVNLPTAVAGTLLLVLSMPLAVNNANLASLYDGETRLISQVVLSSMVLFLLAAPVLVWLLR